MIIISHKHKFIYVRPPKTGSSSTQFTLRLLGQFGPDDILSESQAGQFGVQNFVDLRRAQDAGKLGEIPKPVRQAGPHATLDQMLEAGYIDESIKDYEAYAFLRDPYKRHVSGIRHYVGRRFTPVDMRMANRRILTGEGYGEVNKKGFGLLTTPQHPYFYFQGEPFVNILDFRKFEEGVRFMLDKVDGVQIPTIPKMNVRSTWKDTYTYDDFWEEESLRKFEVDYADDIALYKDVFGPRSLKRPKPTKMPEVDRIIQKLTLRDQ